MGKFKSWKYHSLFTDVAVSTCLVGATAGLVFGVSAGTFKVNYMDLENAESRLAAANSSFGYYSQDIGSEWNMGSSLDSHNQTLTEEYWKKMHNNADLINIDPKTKQPYDLGDTTPGAKLTDKQINNRYEYMAMVIDGATHSTMDRSFNQGLYNGIVDFIKNQDIESSKLDAETNNDPVKYNCAHSFKPGADNTTEFINIYSAVAKSFRTVGLAGFNHVSYLEAMGTRDEESGLFKFSNNDFWKTAFILIDGDVTNNQNVASVLFRADQPGWMTGIATSMYFLKNLHLYHDNFQDLSIGAYGGTAIPTVMCYIGGVQRGIEFFNNLILKDAILTEMRQYLRLQDAGVEKFEKTHDVDLLKDMIKYSKNKDVIEQYIKEFKESGEPSMDIEKILNDLYDEYKVRMIKLGAGNTHFSGTFAAGDAIGITKQYLNRGAGAIIAVAGPQSLDSAQEIQNQHSKAIVIGVDTPMEDGDYQRTQSNTEYADVNKAQDGSTPQHANNIIKFSAIKDIKTVTKQFANLCADSKNFDVQAKHLWEHMTKPTYVAISTASEEEKGEIEAQVMPDDAFIIQEINGTKAITGINPDFKLDHKQYTICRIPEGVEKINDEAFDSVFYDATHGSETSFPNVTRIVFNSSNDFEVGKNAFNNCSHIKELDFGNVKYEMQAIPLDGEQPSKGTGFRVYRSSFAGISNNDTLSNCGSIYLNDLIHWDWDEGNPKDKFVNDLCYYSGLTSPEAGHPWFTINPDVHKSVCNIGYKTCGNVENGLISISWDGWVPFMQAMQHLSPSYTAKVAQSNDEEEKRYQSFMSAWNLSLADYISEYGSEKLEEELGEDFDSWKNAMSDINSLITYNRDSLINKYYSHVMGVLGCFMKTMLFNFDKNLTVMVDAQGNLYSPEDTTRMTILEWLRLNMYFNA